MTDTASGSRVEPAPFPSRRQLRRVEEEARAAGEGTLSPEEVFRRAQIALEAEPAQTPPAVPAELDHAETLGGERTEAEAQDGTAASVAGSGNQRAGASPAAPTTAPDDTQVPPPPSDPPPTRGPAAGHDSEPDTAGIPVGHGFVTPAAHRTHSAASAEPGADVAPEEKKDYGRAGRDLPAAIAVGAVLGGGVLAALVFYPPSFVLIALVGVCLAMWELSNALRRSGANVSKFSTLVAAGCMVAATALGGREALWVAFTAGAGAVLLFTLLEERHRHGNAVKDVCVSLFALTYVGLMASFVVHMLSYDEGNLLVICFLALVVASDIGGYASGALLGRHPIAPKISPKKSWEGFAGSALLSTAVGVGMAHWAFDAPLWTGVVLGVVIPAFATLGDFSESMIKRDLGLKDMGSLLPGHGGVMDRLDSILPTAPVALILFTFLPGFIV